jgi:hypothetical protein
MRAQALLSVAVAGECWPLTRVLCKLACWVSKKEQL